MDLLVVAPAVAWGTFIAYVVDLVTKKPDREWETFARYTPVRWFVSPSGRQIGWWVGAFLPLCAVASAWQRPAEALVGFVLYAVTFGQTRWPWRKKDLPVPSPSAAALSVAADAVAEHERQMRSTNVVGARFQSGILTFYVRRSDPVVEAFFKAFVHCHQPDLPVYVVEEGWVDLDPNVM